MRVNYPELNFSGESLSDKLFLKNKNLWLILSKEKSRFFGGFYFKNQPFRFLDSLEISSLPKEIIIFSPMEIFLETDRNQIYISLKEENCLEIKTTNFEEISLSFDANFIFNDNPFLRFIKEEKLNSSTYHFSFYFDNQLIMEILVESFAPLNFQTGWFKNYLDFDSKRNSSLIEWWSYGKLTSKTNCLKIKILEPTCFSREIFNLTNNKIFDFILTRLNSLILKNYLPAGLPWFFENWFRDELLSLYLLKDYLKDKKSIFSNYLFNLENKWQFNKENGILAADTLPLIILNIDEEDLAYYSVIFKKYLRFWEETFLDKNGLLKLPAKATWMDTLEKNESLEIYALYLKAIRKLAKIERTYKEKADFYLKLLKQKIKEEYDVNLILVYFLLPEIFSKKEWLRIFDSFLVDCYLSWGGVATQKINSDKFISQHTGENPLSYHSGDSWYYLNNLLALVLKDLNEKKYKFTIQKIIEASLIDLLKDGVLGFSSELSSAKERKSEGSLIQTWSMSSLLLLLSSFQNPDIFFKSLSD